MTVTLRDYQKEAVTAWEENHHRGIFRMATGTGKTYTAIAGLKRLLESHQDGICVIISVPYTHLADQWKESLTDRDITDITQVFGSRERTWKQTLSRLTSDLDIGLRDREIIITTHDTLSSEAFRDTMSNLDVDSLLIADEVHGLGSPHRRHALLDRHEFRLGLSATPRRDYDEEGTEYLLEYFDGIVFEFSLADAIPEYLVEYDYYPVIVEMTADELEDYRQYSRRLATEVRKDEDERDEELIQRLRINRAQIVKSAENKYQALLKTLEELNTIDHLLVYTNYEQIDHVQELLNERGIRQHKFTAREDNDQRQDILQRFEGGKLDALVAMKCLDEGIDIPSVKQAVLMSNSGNSMQFIQRRGRVLRPAPGKDSATIYDFLVVPTTNPDRTLITSEKGILQTEIARFEEFASTARNEIQARNIIQPLRTNYGI